MHRQKHPNRFCYKKPRTCGHSHYDLFTCETLLHESCEIIEDFDVFSIEQLATGHRENDNMEIDFCSMLHYHTES
jgi:hypothetical protein